MYNELKINIQQLELTTSVIPELIHDDFFNSHKEFPLRNLEQQMEKAFLLANW